MRKNNSKKIKRNKKVLKITLSFILILFLIVATFSIISLFKPKNVYIIPANGQKIITLDQMESITLKPGPKSNSTVIIINPQEYPELYSNWTVYFNTSGKEDLLIEGLNGTDYTLSNQEMCGEVEIAQLRCGEKIIFNQEEIYSPYKMKYAKNKVLFPNYECNETSSWTVTLLGCNKHKQKFTFGDNITYANNACAATTDIGNVRVLSPDGITEVSTCTLTLYPVSVSGGDGDTCTDNDSCNVIQTCQESGTYSANFTCDTCPSGETGHVDIASRNVLTCASPGTYKFQIKNSAGTVKAQFDDAGYLFHSSTTLSNQASLVAPANSFIVKNSGGTIVAYMTDAGALVLDGSLTEAQGTVTPPANSLVIQNSAGTNVSYIDSSGNMVLKGYDYYSWLDSY